ncbi:MAG: hypothetical protein Q9190_004322 [Brigantiaea leucoxantha]
MTKRDHLTRHAAEKALKGTRRLQDKVMGTADTAPRKGQTPPQLRTGTNDLNGGGHQKAPDSGTPSLSTFFSDSPDSPIDLGMTATIRDCGHDPSYLSKAGVNGSQQARQIQPVVASDMEVAPWLSEESPVINGETSTESVVNDRHPKAQRSPSFRPDTRASDSTDPTFYDDERRPSLASATTISSQNSTSTSRASHGRASKSKKFPGFFGEDSQESSRSSEANALAGHRDHSTASQTRKLRYNAVHTNNADGRPSSPPSSRPRSPLPSSDVTPWLFQDFKRRQQFSAGLLSQEVSIIPKLLTQSLNRVHLRFTWRFLWSLSLDSGSVVSFKMALFLAWQFVLSQGALTPFQKHYASPQTCSRARTNDWAAKEIQQFGDAPVRPAPAGPDRQRYGDSDQPSSHHHHHHHRLHFPGHRHTRSKDEAPRPPAKDASSGVYPSRPPPLRQESSASIRALKDSISSPMASRSTLNIRGTSPTPSSSSTIGREVPQSQTALVEGHTGKRSLFEKFRGHKGERKPHESLNHLIGSKTSLHESPIEMSKPYKYDFSSQKKMREGSVATFDSGTTAKPSDYAGTDPPSSKKEGGSRLLHSHGKFPRPRRGFSSETLSGKELDKTRNGSVTNESLFHLDTNLNNMEGIVNPDVKPVNLPYGGIFTGEPISEEPRKESKDPSGTLDPGAWDAPDSWAVKKIGDENMARLREMDEAGEPPRLDDDGTPHCIRVFRIDSTFATLSTGVNTTVAEVLQTLGKKSFLQDDLDNYQIIIRKHDLQRQLNPNERPIAIQKTLLEQAGYLANDRIEEIGREDNGYLCRFTFVPTKLSGYYSLEKEPGQGKMQKFSHVDLQGRSLVTIPITLYQKSNEIVSLNLSRNLALDVPKDFIQGCTNLREIRYISNEAWHLPPSFSLATKLTVLDLSNNCLEQLEHANLDSLQNLVSIKLSNNKIKHLPAYFNRYKSLRSLNVSSNYLESFPDFLCELRALVDLDISFNSIEELPKIGQLVTLERLWATNNLLQGSLPEQLSDLKNLKEVDIRFNAITNLDVFTTLPRLEHLMASHNGVSRFEGHFERIRILHVDHNPLIHFAFNSSVASLTSLNIASANINCLDDSMFEMMPNLTKLNMDKNHFVNISPEIGRLCKLEYLSIARNPLSSLPVTIGNLHELRYLDVRECNLKKLPIEMWCCFRLDTLNVSSNLLESFPKPVAALQAPPADNYTGAQASPGSSATNSTSPAHDDLGKLEDFSHRRPSQASGNLLSVGSSPATGNRHGSIVSVYGPGGRKASVISRTPTDGSMTPISRKDSTNMQQRLATTFAGSLRNLYLADNRLTDDVFDELILLPELRILNLSYNDLYDIPQRSLSRWQYLNELYLSGNELTSLPSDDLGEITSLKVLHLNGNKFQTLPAELGKVQKLAVLDVGSNSLKYNVSNWPYDWNWNWNKNLKYLNFSGNKRLEIKPSRTMSSSSAREDVDMTSFTILQHLRVLGLMDVTLTIPSVPEQSEDRRVRTTGSLAGSLAYGMADSLGKHEHLSTIDMVVPKFRGHETETLLGLFDGQSSSSGGSKLAKYLAENFSFHFTEELSKIKPAAESPADALRRTFLTLNKELATAASQSFEDRGRELTHRGSLASQTLSSDDLNSGGVATVMFLDNMELYLAHVGDARAMLLHSDGGHKMLTRRHSPGDPFERERIRRAGGYVSRHGKLNEVLDVSRAFGYIQMMPAVMAAPDIVNVTLREQDEMILVASKELWEYMSPEMVVDVARSERGDLMRAAQKLRDLAMAFGATSKIMVMIVGVSDLRKRERNRYRGQSLSMGPSTLGDDQILPKRSKRKDRPDDSTLQRLDPEVEAPVGEMAIVFTDIKSSTNLWETYPVAMRSAIKIHNEIMRRQLRIIGGFEVKTEGDAFMVAFNTATSALLWSFSVQSHLLEAPWPGEILNSVHCAEVLDSDQNVIYKGVSVRMGMHWGSPVCELDPVTRRMDYFGPMVNRASRISGAADGGQIYVSSDFIAEIHRVLETYDEQDRSGSFGSDDDIVEDKTAIAIQRELRQLSSQGFEVKDLGSHKLKGLENPEYLYFTYPHALRGRLVAQQARSDAEAAAASVDPASKTQDSQLTMETQNVWDLWGVSLRLEMLCSALESPGVTSLRAPERSVLERMKNRGGEVTDRFLVAFVEHQVARVEASVSALYARNLLRPFQAGRNPLLDACPMGDIWQEISSRLAEHEAMKSHRGPTVQTER